MKIKMVIAVLVSLYEIMATPAATLNWRLKLPRVILDERAGIIQSETMTWLRCPNFARPACALK